MAILGSVVEFPRKYWGKSSESGQLISGPRLEHEISKNTKQMCQPLNPNISFSVVRFLVLTAPSIKMTISWDAATCSLIEEDQRFTGSYRVRHHIALKVEAQYLRKLTSRGFNLFLPWQRL
jgi:hypothetical protein